MRALFKLVLLLILLSPLALAVLAWFMLSDTPTVTRASTLSHQDIARAKHVVGEHDPRRLQAGETRTIVVAGHDLDLAAAYLVRQLTGGGSRLTLATDQLRIEASGQLPFLPMRNRLNIDATLGAPGGEPAITALRIGRVAVPASLATAVAGWLIADYYRRAGLDNAAGLVRDVRIHPDRLELTYRWHPRLIDEARDTLLTGGDREALRHYHDLLVDLQNQGVGTRGSLVALLQPMFADATRRSRDDDPVEENTALLTVLGTWSSRQDLSRLVPGNIPRPGRFRLTLQRRADFAQHFLTSAALAARGDGSLSDAVGLFKEITDTDRGSGFSFTDIAADRSGSRFGELATRSAADARRVQSRLAAGVVEKDIMPPARDLPEHMKTDAFRDRFGEVGSPAYQAMMDEIERRIDACSLYRG